MITGGSSKRGFILRLRKLARDRIGGKKRLEDGQFRVIFVLAALADERGRVCYGFDALDEECGLSRRGLQKVLSALVRKKLARKELVAKGEILFGECAARRSRFIYVLSEEVCGVPSPPTATGEGEHGSPNPAFEQGEPSSPMVAAIEGVLGSPEPRAPRPANPVPDPGERRAPPLRDRDLIMKNDREGAVAPRRREHTAARLARMNLQVLDRDKIVLRTVAELVNEAIEDGIEVPQPICETLDELERRSLIERTRRGKIEAIAVTELIDLSALDALPPVRHDEVLDTLITETADAMKAKAGEGEDE